MKIMATVMQPTAGTILINGCDVTENPQEIRKMIGYLPQSFGFYPNVQVSDCLEYIGALKGLDKRKLADEIEKVLQTVNLIEHSKKKIKALSGGMKQRLGIAQALLGDPKVLIVDEPTAGLDPEERVRFRRILTEMSVGKTVILSTHIVGDIEASCSRLAVLNEGHILYEGSLNDLKEYARDRVWELEVSIDEYREIKEKYKILEVKQIEGGMQVQVMHKGPLPKGKALTPNIELGYFCLLQKENKANARSA